MIRIASHGRSLALLLLTSPFLKGGESVAAPPPPPALAAVGAPQRERLVSPRTAAMLAAAMPKYEPKPPGLPPVEGLPRASDSVVVLMAPVIVIQSKAEDENHRLLAKIQEKKQKIEEEAFNWKDGGTLFEKGRIKVLLKYGPKQKGFDLLNLKW